MELITAVKSFMIQAIGVGVIELFFFVTDILSKQARVFILGKTLQPNKALITYQFQMLHTKGRLLALPANIRIGCIGNAGRIL